MKLTTQYTQGAFKQARNVIIKKNRVSTRQGATQLINQSIEHAIPWLDFVIYESEGALKLYNGDSYRLSDSFGNLSGCTFSAFTDNGERQNRFYYLNKGGILNYSSLPLAQLSTVVTVKNTIKDSIGAAYSLPDAIDICTWRDRLWLADGHNRVHHSNYQSPHAFDPLDSLEFQTGYGDNTTCIIADGERLLVGTELSIWQVTGTSRNNWQRDQISGNGIGIVGPKAIASDGKRVFHVSRQGVFMLGNEQPLSDEVADFFTTQDKGAQLEIDPTGEFLFVLNHGRLLVLNTLHGGWSEIDLDVIGLFRTTSQLGFYGLNGLWVFTREGQPDIDTLGHNKKIDWQVETWTDTPNPQGRDRLNDISIQAASSSNTDIHYTAIIDHSEIEPLPFNAYPASMAADTKLELWNTLIENMKRDPVNINLSIYESGQYFSHRLSGDTYTQIHGFGPTYKGIKK